MTEVNIRICDYTNPDHTKGIADLINAYIEDTMGGGEPLSATAQMELTNGLRRHPASVVLLAEADRTVCGLLVAFENFSTFTIRPMINIHDLIVLPGYRRKGIGRQLLEAVIAIGRERGCSRITLEVRKDNLSAQHLYQSLGFGDPLPAMHYWRKELE